MNGVGCRMIARTECLKEPSNNYLVVAFDNCREQQPRLLQQICLSVGWWYT
jgi:hypothetical protein